MKTSSPISINQTQRCGSVRASLLACSTIVAFSVLNVSAVTKTWVGNNVNWQPSSNWTPGGGVNNGDDLVFNNLLNPTTTNNINTLSINSITFGTNAGAFNHTGNALTIAAGGVTNNNTANIQTISLAMTLSSSSTAITTAAGGQTVIAGALGGTGGVLIAGDGTAFFNVTNGYTGTTTVSAGRLNVNGSIALGSAVTVNSGGTMGGDGIINGNVTIDTNGTLDVGFGGTTDRTMNIGGTLTSSGSLAFRVGGELATQRDMLTVGTLNLNSSTLTTFFTDGSVANMGSAAEASLFITDPTAYTSSSVYQIISGSNTTGMFTNAQIMDAGLASLLGLAGTQYTISSGGQNFWVTNQASGLYLVAVPEPGVTLLSMFGLLGLVCRRRR